MYDELLKTLDAYSMQNFCTSCPSGSPKCFKCLKDTLRDAAATIRMLQDRTQSKMIDLDASPDDFCKHFGGTKCFNGTEYIDMFAMGYEDDIFVLDIKSKSDLALLGMYMSERRNEIIQINPEYVGKRILVNFWDGDGAHIVGTREEMRTKFEEYLDKVFEKETSND